VRGFKRPYHHSHHHCYVGFGFYWNRSRYPDYYSPYFAYPYTYSYPYAVASPVYYGASTPVVYNQTTVVAAPATGGGVVYPDSSGYGTVEQPGTGYGQVEGAPGVQAPVEGVGPTEVAQDPNAQPNAEQLFVMMFEGTRAFEAGEYETAARLFMRVAMQDPDNVDAALAYAVSRFATGDYSIAAIAIRRGVRAYPEVVNAPFDIRHRYGNPTDFDHHRQALERFVEANPGTADALLVLGFVQHFSRQREEAAATFNRLAGVSTTDRQIAEAFLNARPLEEIDAEMEQYEAEMIEKYGPPAENPIAPEETATVPEETPSMPETGTAPSSLMKPDTANEQEWWPVQEDTPIAPPDGI